MDLPRSFVIREQHHRIHNPFSEVKLADLGRALRLPAGATMLDLACGSGEMLCTWSRDHGISGIGVDISTLGIEQARARAAELGVSERVSFVHDDAAGYVLDEPVDLAACIGATWIGNGVPGTLDLLSRSLRPGGLVLIGEPFWQEDPPDEATARACHAQAKSDFLDLPGLVESFGRLGWDLVEMVLADGDSWDRYAAAQWLTIRRWLDDNPDDELAPAFRDELDTAPLDHVRYQRRYLGWGVFALMERR
ncbi:class I SAM-dependent methyltransferase [Actinoplanes sp. Pm04-4]|uniref:Class I SAM-dependent methyltransferase n=1 Tax=Paractinoplanes pyxinae TaxID=2997416 RepID=A0ABT4B8W3_9ACTN|nr:class I SAM-dependent methyltransferase [Actinoplanes pyxinae]MCY1142940.1 class I SAM-dependent methyltransferase [Actinoplanes pyxinae]